MKSCKFCNSQSLIKYDKTKDSQRYFCKDCERVQVKGDLCCTHCSEAKKLAVILYLEGNGFRRISRILNQIFKHSKISFQIVHHWINSAGSFVEKEVARCKQNSSSNDKTELAAISFIPASKKPRKNKETGIQIGDYTRIWTVVDRNSGSLFEFEVGDGSKSTYLKIAFRVEEARKIKHLCTDGNKIYCYCKISEHSYQTKSETCLVESWNCRLGHYIARLHRKTLCYSKSLKALATAVLLFIHKEIALSTFI